MIPIELRPATATDIDTVAAIYSHHVQYGLASFEIVPPTAAEMRSRFVSITQAGYPWLVAVDGDAVLAYAYACAYRSRPGYRYTVEDSVYVDAGASRRGIGRRLLTRLIDECERRGYRQMLAVIGDSANAASIELHRACGFAHIGTMQSVGLKFGRWIDSVLMQRTLGAGDRSLPE